MEIVLIVQNVQCLKFDNKKEVLQLYGKFIKGSGNVILMRRVSIHGTSIYIILQWVRLAQKTSPVVDSSVNF